MYGVLTYKGCCHFYQLMSYYWRVFRNESPSIFILRRMIMATKDTKKDSKDKKKPTKTLKEKRAAKKEKQGK